MAARAAYTVVNISLSGPEWDHDRRVTFMDRTYRLVRVGTAGDVEEAQRVAARWSGRADAIAVSGVRADPEDLRALFESVKVTPVTDGTHLAKVLAEWAVRKVQVDMPGYFSNARTVVLGGENHAPTVKVLREFTSNLVFADPWLEVAELVPGDTEAMAKAVDMWSLPYRNLPHQLTDPVDRSVDRSARSVGESLARRAAKHCDVLVGTYDEIIGFGDLDLTGKTVLTNAITETRLAELAARNVDLVVDATPQPFPFGTVDAVLEAMMMAAADASTVSNDMLLSMLTASGLEPRLLYPNGYRRRSRFAFVIHPLSTKYFDNVKPLGAIRRLPGMGGVVERAMAYVPPFPYGHVTGIVSPTGAEAEGWLITVGGTPKQMMARKPEATYAQMLAAADIAKRMGAQIMGLGAFTKVVGDAGVTVARKASLPVTTGNSYSASGALWAAHAAVRRLGLAEIDEGGQIKGKAMVVGATGSIGSACARLLAQACDELWLVSPETAKLLALKSDIESEDHRAEIFVADKPNPRLHDMDLIVTATSAAGHKVLDIMKVKPGCVITDVARPLDLSAEDVAKRPDVLVIESGEVELPGEDVKLRNIGLPPRVAYACLAETIVLALEGRYETFTVGRNIEWPKVKEIYRLGLKHGMQLATISGVNGVFTDEDFERVRELATKARAEAATGNRRTRTTGTRLAKKAAAKKAAATKTAAARKSTAKKSAAASTAKKTAARKTAATKTAASRTGTAKKTTAKKATAKKAAVTRTAAKKTASRRAAKGDTT